MPRIRSIEIKNFRSIKKLNAEITDFSVFVGDNDAGKSNILRALNLFFNNETERGRPFDFLSDFNFHRARQAKRAPEIDITVTLELPAGYHATNGQFIRWRKRWRREGLVDSRDYVGIRKVERRGRRAAGFEEIAIPEKSNAHTLLQRIDFEYVPAIRSEDFLASLRGRIFRVISDAAEENVRASSDAFQAEIGDHVGELLTSVKDVLGDETRLELPSDLSTIFERLDFRSGENSVSLNARGDGIKGRYIPLILSFIADKRRALFGRGGPPHTFIWAYEEPENNLEYRRADELAKEFLSHSRDDKTQILITTHSPVFFNRADCEDDARTRVFYVFREDEETGTVATDRPNDLDEKMGLMPIVAPYIQEATSRAEELRIEYERLRAERTEANPDGLPTLYVEGITEYRLACAIRDRLEPDWADQIFIARPPDRAGSNYVANALRAWSYSERHRAAQDRETGYGVVDGDAEGVDAATRFGSEKLKFTKIAVLGVPAHLRPIHTTGFKIPVCLEELFPVAVWQELDAQGWLVDRNLSDLVSHQLVQRMLGGEQIGDLIDPDWEVLVRRRPNPDRKTAIVEYLLDKEDGDFERATAEFAAQLTRLLT